MAPPRLRGRWWARTSPGPRADSIVLLGVQNVRTAPAHRRDNRIHSKTAPSLYPVAGRQNFYTPHPRTNPLFRRSLTLKTALAARNGRHPGKYSAMEHAGKTDEHHSRAEI